jgi:hypothetical protein
LLVPVNESDLTTNLAGGAITAEGIMTFFCEAGYTTPTTHPGTEPCRRPNLIIPAYPVMVIVSWEAPGGALRFVLTEGNRNLSGFTTLSLRAAVDPLSPLNAASAPQSFSVQLTDGSGTTAVGATRSDEPALAFPLGLVRDDEFFGETFNGRAPLTTLRLSLADFAGINLSDVVEIALVFDQSESGSLFLGDVELVRPPDS